MKLLFSLTAALLCTSLHAQWHPFLNDFNVTMSDRAAVDIGLICGLENPEFNQIYLGEKMAVIPAVINGDSIELDINRFRVIVADTLFSAEQPGLLLFLIYDRQTKSTQDDLVVQQVFFPLRAKTLDRIDLLNGDGVLKEGE